MRATRGRWGVSLVAAMLTWGVASGAFGIPATLGPSRQGREYEVKRDKMHIGWQVSVSLQRELRGLQILAAGADLETLTEARAVVDDSYTILRAAHNGLYNVLTWGKNPKPNPPLVAQYERIERTRVLLRKALGALDRAKTALTARAAVDPMGMNSAAAAADERRANQYHAEAVEHLTIAVQEHREIRIF